MINNDNFCVQPWIHLASWNDGNVPLCCIASPEQGLNLNQQTPSQVWNSEQFKTARLMFLEGEKLPQCNSCWKEEASGIKSHRIIENQIWQRKLGTDYLENLIASTHGDGSVDHKPIALDLRLGNTCNLQCVMCRPRDSSKWLQDSKKLASILVNPQAKGDWDYKANSISNTDCFDWFERLETQNSLDEFIGDIRHIIFGGGEPLLIKDHERFITKLVESGASKNIELRYHTNGTIMNEKFISLWDNFKEVEIMVSLDDWGTRNDYVRYPANWEVVSKNLDRLDDTGDNIVVSLLTTVHAMNIYNLPDFAINIINRKWKKICKRNEGLFSIGTTHWPQYMSTRVLPLEVKDKVVEYWNTFDELKNNKRWTNRIVQQLDFMNQSDDSQRFPALLDYIDKLDSIRPIQFSNLYKEYYEILRK
jgi:MoaA/NifB/PqqE/SkfB family radical SAM enzyme